MLRCDGVEQAPQQWQYARQIRLEQGQGYTTRSFEGHRHRHRSPGLVESMRVDLHVHVDLPASMMCGSGSPNRNIFPNRNNYFRTPCSRVLPFYVVPLVVERDELLRVVIPHGDLEEIIRYRRQFLCHRLWWTPQKSI